MHFPVRELVNIYLVHHIHFGAHKESSIQHDEEDLMNNRIMWDNKPPNVIVAAKLTQIEDIFKARDATG